MNNEKDYVAGWSAEFGDEWQVPKEFDALVGDGYLEDCSWHNDVSPSFRLSEPQIDEMNISIFVDHPNPEQREVRAPIEKGRFSILIEMASGQNVSIYEGDDLNYVVAFIKNAVRANQPR